MTAPGMRKFGSPIPPLGVEGRRAWAKNWPRARGLGAQKRDPRWSTETRQQRRRAAMEAATEALRQRYGGERRRQLRAMGRALAKRKLREEGAAA